jgi:Domain of Unknown Function (DUF1206)
VTISSGPVPAAPRGLPHTPAPDWHDAPGHWSELALGAVLDDAPDEVAGLDVALRTVAEHTLGTTALAIASLGFAAYGLYCLVDAYARHP